MRNERVVTVAVAVFAVSLLCVGIAPQAVGFGGSSADGPDTTGENPEWREGFESSAFGADVDRERVFEPDNPHSVGMSVLGANVSPDSLSIGSGLSPTSVTKSNDTDGDGDPDTVRIQLELVGINEEGSSYSWDSGNGEETPWWVLAPETKVEGRVSDAVRPPSPVFRVEGNDKLVLDVENNHRLNHSLSFEGLELGNVSTQGHTIHTGESATYVLRPRKRGIYSFRSKENEADSPMGISGTVVVEENRSDNRVQSLNLGGGKVRAPSRTVAELYDAEYDLLYGERYEGDVDDSPDAVTLNGRTYPHTLHDSLIVGEEGDSYRINMVNTGTATLTVRTEAGKLSLPGESGAAYKTVNSVELKPYEAKQVRLKVENMDGKESLYVEERGEFADDGPTTFVASGVTLNDDYLPEEVPVESSPKSVFVGFSGLMILILVGVGVGVVTFFGVDALKGRVRED